MRGNKGSTTLAVLIAPVLSVVSVSAQPVCIRAEVRARAEACEPRAEDSAARTRSRSGATGARATSASVLVAEAVAAHTSAEVAGLPAAEARALLERAHDLYTRISHDHPDLDRLDLSGLPDGVAAPTLFGISYLHAEALWRLEQWDECAAAFDVVFERSGLPDAAYAALLCHNAAAQRQNQAQQTPRVSYRSRRVRRGRRGGDEPTVEPRRFGGTELRMARAHRRFLCVSPESNDAPSVRYRLGRLHYEANHFEMAAFHFEHIARNHPASDVAEYAANLYLDSLNVLGSQAEAPREECLHAIRDAVPPLEETYCSTDDLVQEHDDLCRVLGQLSCNIQRQRAESLGAHGHHAAAADVYLRLAESDPDCGARDEVLYNAAIHREAAGQVLEAIAIRTRLRDHYADSHFAKVAQWEIAVNHHALAMFEQAAEAYATFARRFPGEDGSACGDDDPEIRCLNAQEGLRTAIYLYMGLNDRERVIEAARLFERNYRRRLPMESAEVVASLAAFHERHEGWRHAVAAHERLLASYGRTITPDMTIAAHVGLARTQPRLRRSRRVDQQVEQHLQRAVEIWSGGAVEQIDALDMEEQGRARARYRARRSTAEALYRLAELGRENFDADSTPPRSSRAAWVQTRREALVRVEQQYNRVARLEVPEWIIASARRIGEMYRGLGELDSAEQDAFRRQARDKFEFCFVTAQRTRSFSKHSIACADALSDDPNRPRELTGAANNIVSEFALPGESLTRQ